jgi:hypothetical protein
VGQGAEDGVIVVRVWPGTAGTCSDSLWAGEIGSAVRWEVGAQGRTRGAVWGIIRDVCALSVCLGSAGRAWARIQGPGMSGSSLAPCLGAVRNRRVRGVRVG